MQVLLARLELQLEWANALSNGASCIFLRAEDMAVESALHRFAFAVSSERGREGLLRTPDMSGRDEASDKEGRCSGAFLPENEDWASFGSKSSVVSMKLLVDWVDGGSGDGSNT